VYTQKSFAKENSDVGHIRIACSPRTAGSPPWSVQ